MDTLHVPPAGGATLPRYTIAHYPVALIDRLTLADGRVVTVRPVLPQDAPLMQAFVRGLSQTSRYLRFHQGLGELPARLLRDFTELDYGRHLGLIAEIFDDADGERIIADARLVRRPDEAAAEVAVVVDDGWQAGGLGGALLGSMLRVARTAGLAHVDAEVLAGNSRMLGLLRRHGFTPIAHREDPRVVRMRLAVGGPVPS